MSNSLNKTSDLLIRSFLVRDLSDLLTSIIFHFGEGPERFAHVAHLKRGNEQIPRFFLLTKNVQKRTKKYDFSQNLGANRSLIFISAPVT